MHRTLIAVTSQNRRTVTAHAGKCRKFWLYSLEYATPQDGRVVDKTLLELPLEHSLHSHHGPNPHPLQARGVQTLICGGMGAGLQRRLAGMGIAALLTTEPDPDRAVAAWLAGALPAGEADGGSPAGNSDDSEHTHGCGCGDH
jgi:predicted Fe-Mo cluster-binding NifX family protein